MFEVRNQLATFQGHNNPAAMLDLKQIVKREYPKAKQLKEVCYFLGYSGGNPQTADASYVDSIVSKSIPNGDPTKFWIGYWYINNMDSGSSLIWVSFPVVGGRGAAIQGETGYGKFNVISTSGTCNLSFVGLEVTL